MAVEVPDGSCIYGGGRPATKVRVDDIIVTEGDGIGGVAAFPVTLSEPARQNVTVWYYTSDGDARAARDYTYRSGSVTIWAGSTQAFIEVPITGDYIDEYDETFYVYLYSATGAVIGDGFGVARINDNDLPPFVSLSEARILEGNFGYQPATFVATLSQPSEKGVYVHFNTLDQSAWNPSDYLAVSDWLYFAAGEYAKPITVLVNGDPYAESSETFKLRIGNPSNATISDDIGIGTIVNDD
jgi:hypothetical protein